MYLLLLGMSSGSLVEGGYDLSWSLVPVPRNKQIDLYAGLNSVKLQGCKSYNHRTYRQDGSFLLLASTYPFRRLLFRLH